MSRSLVLLLTLIALLWHVVAGASLRVWNVPADDAAHAALHWMEASHHHDDDGGLQLDDSAASMVHMAMDGTVSSVLHFASLEVPRITLVHAQPGYAAPPLNAPYLVPLQRPPRF